MSLQGFRCIKPGLWESTDGVITLHDVASEGEPAKWQWTIELHEDGSPPDIESDIHEGTSTVLEQSTKTYPTMTDAASAALYYRATGDE